MDSSEASLLQQDDHILSIRKRNKKIIIALFSLITSLSLIIVGFIVSFLHKNNLQSHQSLLHYTAIREFCYVSEFEFNCINSLYSAIKPTPYLSPNQIFLFSLEKSVTELNDVVSLVPVNCSGLVRHAVGQIESGLGVIRVNPDLERLTYEEKRDLVAWILTAIEDLRWCMNESRENGSTVKISEVQVWLRYSGEFLLQCDMVNENFRVDLGNINVESWRNRIVDDLLEASLFGTQYFVLMLLFCLLLRCYR